MTYSDSSDDTEAIWDEALEVPELEGLGIRLYERSGGMPRSPPFSRIPPR